MAYENMTYEYLFERMKERVTDKYPNLDSRESSMIYNALSSEAMELAIAYTELDNVRNETFIQTASRDGKIKRCEEQNIDVSIFDSTYGTFEGKFDGEITIGSRWNLDLYNYTVTEFRNSAVESETTYYYYAMECETAGSAANSVRGMLVPITDAPAGVTYSELTNVLIPGRDEFTDEEIEEYYISHVNGTATDGNVAQYQQWCDEYPDVGNHKIFPCWNGINTVEVSILDNENGIASDLLIKEFQEYLDPPTSYIEDEHKTNGTTYYIDDLIDNENGNIIVYQPYLEQNKWSTLRVFVEGNNLYMYYKEYGSDEFKYYGYKPNVKPDNRTVMFVTNEVECWLRNFKVYKKNQIVSDTPHDISNYNLYHTDNFSDMELTWTNGGYLTWQQVLDSTEGSINNYRVKSEIDNVLPNVYGLRYDSQPDTNDFVFDIEICINNLSTTKTDPYVGIAIVDPDVKTESLLDSGMLLMKVPSAVNQSFNVDLQGTVVSDYPQGRGMGNGKAPIGAIVTVTTATQESIKLAGTIKLNSGYTSTASIDTAVDEYFNSIAYETSVVNYFSLAAIISNCECVEELNNLTVNGAQQNVTLGDRKIPVRTSSDWSVTE